MRIGIYPGTFDPVTNGHIDIIHRAAKVVDTLIIGVADVSSKNLMFNTETRMRFIAEQLEHKPLACAHEIKPITGLLVDFRKKYHAHILFRGLRAVADFDYEFQMAMMNRNLDEDMETVFLMASEKHQFISSRLVKEVAALGGNVAGFVPEHVHTALQAAFKR